MVATPSDFMVINPPAYTARCEPRAGANPIGRSSLELRGGTAAGGADRLGLSRPYAYSLIGSAEVNKQIWVAD